MNQSHPDASQLLVGHLSISTRQNNLNAYNAYLRNSSDPIPITKQKLSEYAAKCLSDGLKNTTVVRYMHSICSHARNIGNMSNVVVEECKEIVLAIDKLTIPDHTKQAPMLTQGIVNNCFGISYDDANYENSRHFVVIGIGLGARVNEVFDINIDDVELADELGSQTKFKLVIRQKVKSKRNPYIFKILACPFEVLRDELVCPCTSVCAAHLLYRRVVVCKSLNIHSIWRLTLKQIIDSIIIMLSTYGKIEKEVAAKWTSHSIRRTAASLVLRSTADIILTAALGNWAILGFPKTAINEYTNQVGALRTAQVLVDVYTGIKRVWG